MSLGKRKYLFFVSLIISSFHIMSSGPIHVGNGPINTNTHNNDNSGSGKGGSGPISGHTGGGSAVIETKPFSCASSVLKVTDNSQSGETYKHLINQPLYRKAFDSINNFGVATNAYLAKIFSLPPGRLYGLTDITQELQPLGYNDLRPPLYEDKSYPGKVTGHADIVSVFNTFLCSVKNGVNAQDTTHPAIPSFVESISTLFSQAASFQGGKELYWLFSSGSTVLSAVDQLRKNILFCLKGFTGRINALSYEMDYAKTFVGDGSYDSSSTSGSSSKGSSPLVVSNDIINTLKKEFDTHYSTLSSNPVGKGLQGYYEEVFDDYTIDVAGHIANWGYSFIQNLSKIYNPAFFLGGDGAQGNLGGLSDGASSIIGNDYYGLPNITLLNSYSSLVKNATAALVKAATHQKKSVSIGSHVFNGEAGSSFSFDVHNDITKMFADMSAYAGSYSLRQARLYATGEKAPPSTSSSSSSQSSSSTQSSTKGSNTIDPSSTSQTLKSNSVLNVEQEPQATQDISASQASAVIQSIVEAYNDFSTAAQSYGSMGNNTFQNIYLNRANDLKSIIGNFNLAAGQFQNIKPGGDPSVLSKLYDSAIYYFQKVADAFASIGEPELETYVKKMIAQTAIMKYQAILQSQIKEFQPYFQGYIEYAAEAYDLKDDDKKDDQTQQGKFQDIIAGDSVYLGFQTVLKNASQVYVSELNFYESLETMSPNEQQITNDLLNAVKLISHITNALKSIYQDLDDPKTKKSPSCNTSLGGSDNKLLCALSASTTDEIMNYIMSAEESFAQALEEAKQADTLINSKYMSTSVKEYVQFQNLFDQDPKTMYGISTLYDFIYLHQARFYLYCAGELAQSNNAIALYLYYTSLIYYNYLSDKFTKVTEFANDYNSILDMITNYQKTSPKSVEELSTLSAQALQAVKSAKTPDEKAQLYHKALIYDWIYYEISPDSEADASVKAYEATVLDAYDWYNTAEAQSTDYPQLRQAMIHYQSYLLKLDNGDSTAASALTAAQNSLEAFKKTKQIDKQSVLSSKSVGADIEVGSDSTIDKVGSDALTQSASSRLKDAGISVSSLNDPATFQKEQALLTQKMNAVNQLNIAEIQSSLWVNRYQDEGNKLGTLDFSYKDIDFTLLLADLNFVAAGQALAKIESDFGDGKLYNTDNHDAFQSIVNQYEKSSSYYVQAGMPNNGLEALSGVSRTVAFQFYTWVIPIYSYDLSKIVKTESSIKQDSDEQYSTLSSTCYQTDAAILASLKAHPDWPGYVLHYSETLIPPKYVALAQQMMKGSSVNISKKIALPMMNDFITQSVTAKTGEVVIPDGSTDQQAKHLISDFVAKLYNEYVAQVNALLSGKVMACGKPLVSSFSIIQKKGADGKLGYYLVAKNMPMAAIPRFKKEINSAMMFYQQCCLKLYSPGKTPVNFNGQTMIPGNDPDKVDEVNEALYNAYLVDLLSFQRSIQKVEENGIYTKLTSLTPDAKLAITAAQYKTYYDFYTNTVQPIFEDGIAHYQNLLAFANGLDDLPGIGVDAATRNVKINIKWIDIVSNFLLGDPTGEMVKPASSSTLSSSDSSNPYYNNILQIILNRIAPSVDGDDIITMINQGIDETQDITLKTSVCNKIFEIFENAGDILSTLPTPMPTVPYPTAKDSYPAPTPSLKKGTFKKWYDASNYYTIGLQQSKTVYDMLEADYDTSSSDDKALIDAVKAYKKKLHAKLALTIYTEAMYLLSTFAYNAYEECRCPTYSGGDSIGLFQEMTVGTVNADDTGEAVDVHAPVCIVSGSNQTSSGEDIPAASIVPDNDASHFGSKGITFGTYIQHNYQGVAAKVKQSFVPLANYAATAQAEDDSFNNDYGSGDSVVISQAMQFMRETYLLTVIQKLSSLYAMGSDPNNLPVMSLENIIPKVTDTKTRDQNDIDAVSAYIVTLFTKHPGFATSDDVDKDMKPKIDPATKKPYDPQPPVDMLPILQISTSATQGDGDANKAVSQQENYIYAAAKGLLSLSNAKFFYPPTLQYWTSLDTFNADVMGAAKEWLPNYTDFSHASTFSRWVADITSVARTLYGYVYLANRGVTWPITFNPKTNNDPGFIAGQINQELQALMNKSTDNASEYIGGWTGGN